MAGGLPTSSCRKSEINCGLSADVIDEWDRGGRQQAQYGAAPSKQATEQATDWRAGSRTAYCGQTAFQVHQNAT